MPKSVVLIVSIVPELIARVAPDLRAQGFSLCVLSKDCWVGLRLLAPYIKHYAVYDKPYWQSGCPQAFAEFTESYCRKWNVDIILPLEIPMARIAKQAEAFLHTPMVYLFDNDKRDHFNDKWNFYRFLKKHGLDTPKTYRIDQFDLMNNRDYSFPLVLKPLGECGGEGVHVFKQASKLKQYIRGSGVQPPVILQNFVPGKDYAVHLLAKEGALIAGAVMTFTGSLREREFVDRPQVLALVRQIIHHMQYDGIAAVDIRHDEQTDTYHAIEINPRIGSSYYFYSKAGISLCGLWLKTALNSEDSTVFQPLEPCKVQLNLFERLQPFLSSSLSETVGNIFYAVSKRHPFLKMIHSSVMARLQRLSR